MRTLVSTRLRLITVLAALGAASFGVSLFAEAAKKPAKGGHAKAPAQTDDCKTDKDCVLVIDECCSCEQGGKQRAIPKKQKDAYEKDRKKRCADAACTDVMSTDPSCSAKPFCGAGICELGDASPSPDAGAL
jgi:hypothetical protein